MSVTSPGCDIPRTWRSEQQPLYRLRWSCRGDAFPSLPGTTEKVVDSMLSSTRARYVTAGTGEATKLCSAAVNTETTVLTVVHKYWTHQS